MLAWQAFGPSLLTDKAWVRDRIICRMATECTEAEYFGNA